MMNYELSNTSNLNPKDSEIVNNTCPSESICMNKNVLGKFFRKQDYGKIQRKKKPSNEQSSFLCYLTSKNSEQSNREIEQRSKQPRTEKNMQSFTTNNTSYWKSGPCLNRAVTTLNLKIKQHQDITSLQKSDRKRGYPTKFAPKAHQVRQSGQQIIPCLKSQLSSRRLRLPTNGSQHDLLKASETKAQININISNYQKQLRRLKVQCQQYNSSLQASNKQKQQFMMQSKNLTNLVNQLKQKNNSLSLTQEQYIKQITLLNSQVTDFSQQSGKIKEENRFLKDENNNYRQEISYLKGNVRQFNERINELIEEGRQSRTDQQKGSNYVGLVKSKIITSTKDSPKRFSTMLVMTNSGENTLITRDSPTQDQKKRIQQLRSQLKYCQVQINMLKRVKLDINKKNQQFIKLQRQNKILKDQIFEIKTSSIIQQVKNKSSRNQSQGIDRNQYQMNFKKGSKTKQGNIKSQTSSDTISFNLSFSPVRDRFRN